MERTMRFLAGILFAVALALSAACGDAKTNESTAGPALKPLPTPVQIAQEPQGAERGDPSFEALPGAAAYFGELGGAVYRIEMPEEWNGRLVLYLHGFRDFDPTLTVEPPAIRGYLVRNGFAWAASSYSSNSFIPGLAADETAALWDFFVKEFGRPDYTYVTGISMGAGGVAISAERYPDRYDGALGLCGVAGSSSELAFLADFFISSAFVAGVTQEEFEATPPAELLDARILPALEGPAAREQLEEIVIDLTGGPRPFDREGVRLRTLANLELVRSATDLGIDVSGLCDNRETVYRLGPLSDVSDEEFNAAAIRVEASELREAFTAGQDTTGDLQIPLLTLHTTGDGWVPISEQQNVRRAVDAAGRGDLLVQRTVRAAAHCAFTNTEWEAAFEALISWVEKNEKPEGEDLLTSNLSEIGRYFTMAPRLGSPEAQPMSAADETVTLSGTLTLDGEPLEGELVGVFVPKDGLRRDCALSSFEPVSEGRYSLAVAADEAARRCGLPGGRLALAAIVEGEYLLSQELAAWPASGSNLHFDATFSTADPEGAAVHGHRY